MPHDRASGAKPAGPCVLVIFGAAGDLTKRLVVPSLYNLARAKLLPQEFAIVGFDLAEEKLETWKESLTGMLEQFVAGSAGDGKVDQDVWNWLSGKMSYLQGDLNNPESYAQLKTKLAELDGSQHTGGNYLFYLAIADRFFGSVVEQLGKSELACEKDGQWRRVVIEKPFGHDLASAKALNRQILTVLKEPQIYRIDHFLGKETVQNIMLFRFANGLVEPIWNRDRIDHVQITVAESVSVEKRGRFYEKTGALRDMIPNHVFQLVAMTAMEAPNSFDADAVRSEKAKIIDAIRDLKPEEISACAVRGQYEGYRQEPDVAPESEVETYTAV